MRAALRSWHAGTADVGPMKWLTARRGYLLFPAAFLLIVALAWLLVPSWAAANDQGHDTDGDGLLEVTSLAQLDAIRYDGGGRGTSQHSAYLAAFPNAASSCPDGECSGYELAADLDFDTDGSGEIDSGDDFWNSGAGWAPISSYNATFEGNGYSIRNLYLNGNGSQAGYHPAVAVGFFSELNTSSVTRNVNFVSASVTVSGGECTVGALAGTARGTIENSSINGSVKALNCNHVILGGLVGRHFGQITRSHSSADVAGSDCSHIDAGGLAGANYARIYKSYATGEVSATRCYHARAGGLAGINWESRNRGTTVTDGYATGDVSVNDCADRDFSDSFQYHVGGLVGRNFTGGSTVNTSYSTGSVSSSDCRKGVTGGLVADYDDQWSSKHNVHNSYWDTGTSGVENGNGSGTEKTTTELQFPTSATGIYASWNDQTWDFGTSADYPSLRVDREAGEVTGGVEGPDGTPTGAVNRRATGAPTISGTAQAGETLTADTSHIADANGLTNATFSYQWLTGGGVSVPGATSSTYELQLSDVNEVFYVRVSFTDDAGNEEALVSEGVGPVSRATNVPATGAPEIRGTVVLVGFRLTTDTSGIADANGMSNASFSYQWIAGDAVIPGARRSTYQLRSSDINEEIRVRVSFTDDAGHTETLTSSPTPAVIPPSREANIRPTGLPVIIGTARVGETLRVDTSGIADGNGLSNSIFSYQWNRDDGTEIPGATRSAYEIQDSDVNERFRVVVRFTDNAGHRTTMSTSPSEYVVAASGTPNTPATGAANIPATGAPTISGTAQVGETLTADTAGIADADGLTNATFSYQWLADDADVSGATGSSYTLADTDEGKAVKVRVDFTDDAGHVESLTSAEVGPVAPAPIPAVTGVPVIGGTVKVGHVLTADTSGISDPDGMDNVSFSYQWLADDTEIDRTAATRSQYVLRYTEKDKAIRVAVSFTDDLGNHETVTSAATGAVAADPLTASVENAPDSHDGQGNFTFDLRFSEEMFALSYANLKNHAFDVSGGQVTRAQRADRSSITRNVGWLITVIPDGDGDVIITLPETTSCLDTGSICTQDGRMLSSSLSFTVTGPVQPNSPATGAPTISGTAQVGQTLTADTSGISDGDGLANATFSYQWMADDSDISGATGASYTLADADEGKAVSVRVSFTDDRGNDESLTSVPTSAVEARPNTPATGAPTISGTAQVGETLTADTSGIADADGLVNVSYGYQWIADDSDIAGATGASYTLADADEGKAVKVRVSFTDGRGNVESLTSAPTSLVAARPNTPATGAPVVSGTAQVGETLTADTSGISDADGLVNVTYGYQWIADDADIPGATGRTYTLADSDEGRAVRVRVSFTDGRGNDESLTSAEIGPVAAGQTAPEQDTVPTVSDTSQFRNHDATAGEAFSLTLPAADAGSGNGGPYEYRLWHRGQPGNFADQAINGLRFDPATRTLSGTPEGPGVWLLSYVVHDGDDNRTVEDRFRERTNLQVTVSEAQDTDTAPTVSDTSQFRNHDATVGEAFSLTLPAADAGSGNGEPYQYRLWHRGHNRNFMDQAINGLRFDPAMRTLSGTPEQSGVWLLSYVINDNDGNRSVADRFRARTNLQITVSAE